MQLAVTRCVDGAGAVADFRAGFGGSGASSGDRWGFEIRVHMPDGSEELIWERKRDGGFPEAKVLKQRVRDLVWPERDLGHSDRPVSS